MKISKERLKYELKEHVADSTSIIALTMPIQATIESFGANMSLEVSLNSRLFGVALTYMGLSRIAKLRDYVIDRFDLKNKSKAIQLGHDMLYGLVIGPTVKTGIYLAAGETDWKKIAIGALGTTFTSAILSGAMGYWVDVSRDLLGVKESNRTPEFLKEKTKNTKKVIFAGALATSLALTATVYGLKYGFNNEVQKENNLNIERVEKIRTLEKSI